MPFKILYLFLETFEPFFRLKGWIVCYTAVSVLSRNAPPLKDEFARFFKPCWVYSNLLKMSNVGEFPWSWFLGDRTQVKKEVVCSIVVQWRQRNVHKSVMHVQICCFANQTPSLLLKLSYGSCTLRLMGSFQRSFQRWNTLDLGFTVLVRMMIAFGRGISFYKK